MRPALLRLLKRPSTLSLLNELNSSAAGIEQLSVTEQCTTCRLPWKNATQYRATSSATKHSATPAKLHFHDIIRPDLDHTAPRHAPEAQYQITTEEDRKLQLSIDGEMLEYESDFGHQNTIGSRLLDDPRRSRDFRLWKEVLRYRKRHYGDQGVIDIHNGLVSRIKSVQLPHEGDDADFFWQTFIDVGLRNKQFLDDLTSYSEKILSITGKHWNAFYPSIVGGFLARGFPVEAVAWHRKLQPFHLSHANDIVLLLDAALSCEPQQPPAGDSFSAEVKTLGFRHGLRAFGEICLATPGHRIFEPLINTLLSRGYLLDALYMSEFLIKQGDLPSDATLIEQLLLSANNEQDNFSRRTRAKIRQIRAELEGLRDKLPPSSDDSEEVPSIPATEEHKQAPEQPNETAWVKEKTFRDEFGARLFATKALSVDTITNGLQMFGVTSIGPLSLKEMAVRAEGPKDILEKIKTLRGAGVTIRDCTFSRVLEKLAADNKDIVLEDFLHSDQHPDVLEDVTLQEEFLCSYMIARDWRLYNMTKAILSDIAKDDLDNIQFRALIAAGQWSSAATVVDKIFLDGNVISTFSISYMMKCFLLPRIKGKHPTYAVDRDVDEVYYAERILKIAFKMQTSFNPKYWVELLIRLGTHRHDQWERIRNLCLWLAYHYGAKDSPILQSISRSNGVEGDVLLAQRRKDSPRIFNPRLQMALVSWGFKLNLWDLKDQDMSDGHSDTVLRWVRGLILLRDLDRMGVQMHRSFIRQACRERLQILYGQERYSDRSWNRTFRQHNPFKLSRVLGDMLKIWPTLLKEEERNDIHKFIDRPLTAFQARKLTSKHEYEWFEQWRNK